MEGSLDDLISIVQSTSVQLLDLRVVPASREDAEILGLGTGDPVTQCTRLRLHHGEPYGHLINVIAQDYGKRLTRHDWKGSVLRVLEDKLRLHLRDAEQTVRAALADAGLARLLGRRWTAWCVSTMAGRCCTPACTTAATSTPSRCT